MQKIDTIKKLQSAVKTFIAEREWQAFQTPKNVSTNLSVEAAELLEFFIWAEGQESYKIVEHNRTAIEHEVADIMITLLTFCSSAKIDLEKVVEEKLELIKAKYPVENVKGHHSAYYKIKLKKDQKNNSTRIFITAIL